MTSLWLRGVRLLSNEGPETKPCRATETLTLPLGITTIIWVERKVEVEELIERRLSVSRKRRFACQSGRRLG